MVEEVSIARMIISQSFSRADLLLGRMLASHHSTRGTSSSLPSRLGARRASLVAEEMPVLRAAEAMSDCSRSN